MATGLAELPPEVYARILGHLLDPSGASSRVRFSPRGHTVLYSLIDLSPFWIDRRSRVVASDVLRLSRLVHVTYNGPRQFAPTAHVAALAVDTHPTALALFDGVTCARIGISITPSRGTSRSDEVSCTLTLAELTTYIRILAVFACPLPPAAALECETSRSRSNTIPYHVNAVAAWAGLREACSLPSQSRMLRGIGRQCVENALLWSFRPLAILVSRDSLSYVAIPGAEPAVRKACFEPDLSGDMATVKEWLKRAVGTLAGALFRAQDRYLEAVGQCRSLDDPFVSNVEPWAIREAACASHRLLRVCRSLPSREIPDAERRQLHRIAVRAAILYDIVEQRHDFAPVGHPPAAGLCSSCTCPCALLTDMGVPQDVIEGRALPPAEEELGIDNSTRLWIIHLVVLNHGLDRDDVGLDVLNQLLSTLRSLRAHFVGKVPSIALRALSFDVQTLSAVSGWWYQRTLDLAILSRLQLSAAEAESSSLRDIVVRRLFWRVLPYRL